MSTVPNDSIVAAAILALDAFVIDNRDQAALLLASWTRRDELDADAVKTVLDFVVSPALDRATRLRCPEWCTFDHRADDVRDDLISHMSDDHTDGSVRELLDARVDVRVARTDNLWEGTVGVPNLYVRVEAELTTWEQAAELARTILDGFGYLAGAEKP